jgi:nitric oxide reductase subunit B
MHMTALSKWAITLIVLGLLGMTVALTIAGYEQVLVERAELGATWEAYFTAQNLPWYIQAMGWRLAMGVVTFVGFVLLLVDLLTIGSKEAAEEQGTATTAQAAAA